MPKLQSIKQNTVPDALPNFRSLGLVLRTVLLVNGFAFMDALACASSLADAVRHMVTNFALLQPILLSCLLLLYAFNQYLARLPYRTGIVTALLLAAVATLAVARLGGELYQVRSGGADGFRLLTYVMLSSVTTAILLVYFRLRAQALSPALDEARLQALQARIRPHFLFNCINSVLSVVRADPKRAETALEDMADLFRMAMSHGNELVPLRKEVELSRHYLDLEKLRLGDRLRVNWHTENVPDDVLVPPLILQPLLENAVYHGIEPLANGGSIDIRLSRRGNEMHLEIYNPRREPGAHHVGNKLALANIRERLALLFDIEARYTIDSGDDFYRVHIVMPYVREEPA